MIMKLCLALAVLPFLFSACGGRSDPRTLVDEGSKALSSGNYSSAAKCFESAVTELGSDTSSPDWLRAQLGLTQANVHLNPAKAKDGFLALAAANPGKITPDHFSLIGSRLGDAGHLMEAVAVLQAGMAAHTESPHLKALMDDLGRKAENSGDSGALDSLKGLGYVGED
jgi:hypothetical protein